MRMGWRLAAICASASLAACAGLPDLPAGSEAYGVMPAATPSAYPTDYHIGPLDTLSVRVLREEELSFDELHVDARGHIQFPLIGEVAAAGLTATELSSRIAARLNERYLVDPQVSVSVVEAVSYRVTVEGQVENPGMYEIPGSASLLQAVALAGGPTNVARLNEVIVFRTVDGERYAAMFDLRDIRAGRAPDPAILGTDIVVIGRSGLSSFYQDLLRLAPALTATFVQIVDNNN